MAQNDILSRRQQLLKLTQLKLKCRLRKKHTSYFIGKYEISKRKKCVKVLKSQDASLKPLQLMLGQ